MGRWKKGQSGNPAGRTRTAAQVTERARKACKRAVDLQIEIMDNVANPPQLRMAASDRVLDRGIGKAAPIAALSQFTDEELVGELVARRETRAIADGNRAAALELEQQ